MKENKGFLDFLASTAGKVCMTIVFSLIIYGIIYAASVAGSSEVALVTAAICAFFGWRALNRITPDMFLFLSCTGWIVYFFIKLCLSVAIGTFVAPYQLGKLISNAIQSSLSE